MKCSRCEMLGMWDIGNVGWLESELFGMYDVKDVAYSEYGMFGMFRL